MNRSISRSSRPTATPSVQAIARPQIDSMPYLEAAVPVGLVGAGVVALCVLVVDLIAQHAFATPSALGAVFLLGEPFRLEAPIRPALVLGYTLIHAATFIVVAAAAVSAEYTLSREGVPLAVQLACGLLGIFLALQVIFVALTFLLGISWVGELGFERVVVANLIAAFSMALVVYRRAVGRAEASRGARSI